MSASGDVTELLQLWCAGEPTALDRLMSAIYDQLKGMAQLHMNKERKGHTLQATALVNEVFFKMMGSREIDWQSRAHFFSVAGKAMRQILVDHARSRNRNRRGGALAHVTLSDADAVDCSTDELLELNDLLNTLEEIAPRQAHIVELAFFGGLTKKEIAEVLHLSESTVYTELRAARGWLFSRLRREK